MHQRPRRNRKSPAIRNMVRETTMRLDNLIYPLFIVDGKGVKQKVSSMPGNFRWSLDTLLPEIEECLTART